MTSGFLIISSEFPPGPGGIGKHAYDLARSLSAKGLNVSVCASQDFSSEEEIIRFNKSLTADIKLTRFSRTGITTQINRWKTIRREINSVQPSMIILTGRFSLWMGYLIRKKYPKCRVHAFLHGSELRKNNKLHYFFTLKALKSIPGLWAVSHFTKNLVERETGRKDIKVLPNGLWVNDWNDATHNAVISATENNPSLITVGRISKRKGQHRVVQAMPPMLREFPGLHYQIAGISDAKAAIEELAEVTGVKNRITIHGRISSTAMLANLYRSAHVFIMLSENQSDGEVEGFGIAILEANFFGLPAIGSTGCGISDAIIDRYNGRLVDGNDTEAIKEALADIITNYDSYSIRAKEWAMRHDWNKLSDYFIKDEEPQTMNILIPENSGVKSS